MRINVVEAGLLLHVNLIGAVAVETIMLFLEYQRELLASSFCDRVCPVGSLRLLWRLFCGEKQSADFEERLGNVGGLCVGHKFSVDFHGHES